jgi:hypothetical protein
MAINLKMKKKCHIVPPDWLSVGAPRRDVEAVWRRPAHLREQIFFRKD